MPNLASSYQSGRGLVTVRRLGKHDEVVTVDDLVRHTVGEVGRASTGDGGECLGGDLHESFGEHLPVRARELDGIVGSKATVDGDDPGGQERSVALAQGVTGALVDRDDAAGTDGERDPEL